MKFLNCSLPSLAENLALDEALLEEADTASEDHSSERDEVLRLWSAESTFVVLGRSSKIATEVKLEIADQLQVPVLRRVSGGTSIVAAPGCAFYSLLIDLQRRPQLRMLDAAHAYVMNGMCAALRPFEPRIHWTGTCDLVVGDRKIGGNSLRIGRRWMLYHGTLLLDMDLTWIDRLLQHPPREPEYRAGRSHLDFVANVGAPLDRLSRQLVEVWEAHDLLTELPHDRMRTLVAVRYARDEWNRQR